MSSINNEPHRLPKSVSSEARATNEYLNKIYGVGNDYQPNPNWRSLLESGVLTNEELQTLGESTDKQFGDLKLPRSAQSFKELMEANRMVRVRQVEIARKHGLPIHLDRVSADVIKIVRSQLQSAYIVHK